MYDRQYVEYCQGNSPTYLVFIEVSLHRCDWLDRFFFHSQETRFVSQYSSEVTLSCPTLCNPMDWSLPGFSIHGIFQARVLEWVAISFSRKSSQPRDWTQVSRIVSRRFTVWATREVLTVLKLDLSPQTWPQSSNLTFGLLGVASPLCSEKAMAPYSSTLAWKIPWTEKPGRLQSMGWLRVGHDWAPSLSLFTFMHWRRKWQHSSVFAWRIPGTGEPGGLPSMGSYSQTRLKWLSSSLQENCTLNQGSPHATCWALIV